jgi:hypothetical protein
MNLAKVEVLSNGVEVIVKKVVVNRKFGCTLSFMAEMEDKSLTGTTLTTEYDKEEIRNEDFKSFNKETLTKIGMTLPVFKEILKPQEEN